MLGILLREMFLHTHIHSVGSGAPFLGHKPANDMEKYNTK